MLATGGTDNTIFIASGELIRFGGRNMDSDPGFTSAYHTATLLHNGKVLGVGGSNSGGPRASADLYNSVIGTWTATDSLGVARYGHTASLLPNGNVLVAGGQTNSDVLASAELYRGPLAPPSLLNIATRMRVLTGDNVLIAGFIITGTELKRVLIRGIGPSLGGVGRDLV